MIDEDAGGFMSCDGHLSTLWSGDPLARRDGLILHVHDATNGSARVIGRPRTAAERDQCTLEWEPGVAVLGDLRDDVDVFLEICVDPDSGADLRIATLANRSDHEHKLTLTTVLEPVLAPAEAHWAHPVFSKLFVQTEAVPAANAVLAGRRPRSADERHPWLVHALPGSDEVTFETDREVLIHRGRTTSLADPEVGATPFTGSTGNVLDPILALRRTVILPPGDSLLVPIVTAQTAGRSEALALVDRYDDDAEMVGAFRRARARAQEILTTLELDVDRARSWNRAAAGLLLGHPDLAAPAAEVANPSAVAVIGAPPPGVPYAALDVRGHDMPDMPRLGAMLAYWRSFKPDMELVVLHDGRITAAALDLRTIAADTLAPRDSDRILAGAGLVLAPDGAIPDIDRRLPATGPPVTMKPRTSVTRLGTAEPLRHFNGYGGFNQTGDEYVIRLQSNDDGYPVSPPRPWVNVIANPSFGCLVSESGAACTWSGNSRERRLTPWSNDPLLDPHGETLLICDMDSGRHWSSTPGPIPGGGDYEVRHGFGHSRFRREGDGLASETTIFVDTDDPVRFTTLRLINRDQHSRRLAAILQQRLVLGDRPGGLGRFVRTETDADTKMLLARNPAADPFAERVVIGAAACTAAAAVTTQGTDLAAVDAQGLPVAEGLGHGTAACFVQRIELTLEPGETAELVFLLVDGRDEDHGRSLVDRYCSRDAATTCLNHVRAGWKDLTGALQVETPSSALDLMINGWLTYQTLSCRMWGRTAFYQSGGAYGFRDQLQDSTAFLLTRPELCREQILLHASHQFVEGDVLHWWHPPLDRGIRTRFADDLLWLPLLTAEYIEATGDHALLEEPAPLLTARPLARDEDEAFLTPGPSGQTLDIYGHCCLAIDRSLTVGAHGLPLFGCGDWNDGMNRVGRLGRGESVWMGFFLCRVIDAFVPLCTDRGDDDRIRIYEAHRNRLAEALERAGWDGAWYRRGFYDDGAPLGSADSDECRIDALVQAWSVLSGVAPRERAHLAVTAVERNLVSADDGIVKLLAPPFVDTPHDPGYIKGYVAGVRENGGQYTHAALWYVRALAQLGRRDRAAALLEMLTPIKHAETPDQVRRYRIEPYVVAADVYGAPPHVGRGGWSWYTGSSCWMQRTAVESVLGISTLEGSVLVINPCIPDDWPGFTARWRAPADGAVYDIQVEVRDGRADSVVEASLDGALCDPVGGAAMIPLSGDGGHHLVQVILGVKGA